MAVLGHHSCVSLRMRFFSQNFGIVKRILPGSSSPSHREGPGTEVETSRDRHRVSVAAGTARYIPDIVVVIKGFSRSSVGQSYHVNSFADFEYIL